MRQGGDTMNPENSVEEQDEQQEQNQTQELQQGVKDGTNLTKNVASGNYLGAAKDAVNLAKNKTFRRKLIIHNIISALLPIILIIVVGCVVLGVFDAVGNGIESVLKSIGDFFTPDKKNDLAINITEDAIKGIIDSIESTGVSLDDLHLMGDTADYDDPDIQDRNKKALEKYIKKFYEAQAVTQTLYPKPNWIDKLTGGTYGTVYVQRVNENDTDLSNVTKLEYIEYDDMQELISKGNTTSMKKYFSIDGENKLVIPAFTKTIITEDNTTIKDETVVTLTHIDYKSVISQYTTSMNFFLYLAMITQNPEFASAVADLVKDSDIRITLMDKVTTSITNEERNYTVNTKTIEKVERQTYDAWDTNREYPYTVYSNETNYGDPQEKTETTTTTIITTTPVPVVNYAKTWFSEQTIIYEKGNEKQIEENSYDTEGINEDEPDGSGTWITNDITTITTSGSTVEYEQKEVKQVTNRVGEKGDGKKSFVGLLDVKFKIPHSKAEESAGYNLVSGAEMFFYLLQKDAGSQNLENIVRYALYKYTDKSYGVTELDLSVYNIRDFKSIAASGNALSNYIKSWENGELWNYERGTFPTAQNIITENGIDYCKVYEDGSNGHNNFAYGIATFISTEKGKINHPEYGKGYYNWVEECSQYNIDVTKLKEGDLIKLDDALAIYATILQGFEDSVDMKLQANKIVLETYQRDALVAICYQHGIDGTMRAFAEAYNKCGGNSEQLRTEFKYFNGGDARTDANCNLFFNNKYIARDGTEIKAGIIAYADMIHKYMEENNYKYCVKFNNEYEEHVRGGECGLNTTFEESKTGYQNSCCATYVSWVLQEAGYIDDAEHTNSSGELNNLLISKGWQIITNRDELEPGDILYYNYGHIEIYAGDGKVYNAGSGENIRSQAPKGNGISSKLTHGLRPPN